MKLASIPSLLLTAAFWLSGISNSPALPPEVKQVVVARCDGWSSTRATLQCYERTNSRSPWRQVFRSEVPVLLGRNGLAWGRGVLTEPRAGSNVKREGDGKAPAGVFRIGNIYGDPPSLPSGSRYPYRQVTRWDAWIDDPRNPYYNRHYVANPKKVPAWFESQRMRLGDPAYKYLIEIRHNADPPAPGYGSAIFLHVRRGPTRTTAGCTTMEEGNLVNIIRWLRADKNPHYVLLPKAEYTARRSAWRLP